jgi:hypothetical protein
MAIKTTVEELRSLLGQIIKDLDKGERGNKAASQRVRTQTIKLEKVAKLYRKESIKQEKQTTKKAKPKTAKPTPKKSGKQEASAKVQAPRPPAPGFKRKASAKLPNRRVSV